MPDIRKIFIDNGAKLSVEKLDQTEKFIYSKLPEEYREFIKICNGGHLSQKWNYLNVADIVHGGGVCLEKFYGLATGNYLLEMADCYESYRNRLPDTLFPIALDDFGNLLLIGDFNDVKGIYFWDHEREYLQDYENIDFLCTDITSLVAMLGEEPN